MAELVNLTECEKIVMKGVWDAGKDASLVEIMASVRDRYHKDWKRQTVSTFLLHLIQKGYLTSYRVGRVFYYHEEVSLEEYRLHLTGEFLSFWYDNSRQEFERVAEKLDLL
ncbi:MAG: BlaI/MecI/CopY family transcriptional regulator [Lachnospiraceae bacterium]|nr:BlaI/MecI/CopY family transcriptional regulator [Lachnospiraceae bacterium]